MSSRGPGVSHLHPAPWLPFRFLLFLVICLPSHGVCACVRACVCVCVLRVFFWDPGLVCQFGPWFSLWCCSNTVEVRLGCSDPSQWDASYATVLVKALQYDNLALPLKDHLFLATTEKNSNGEWFSVSWLLNFVSQYPPAQLRGNCVH